MLRLTSYRISRLMAVTLFCLVAFARLSDQPPSHYEPTLESLDRHPLPEWYADAKLGILDRKSVV